MKRIAHSLFGKIISKHLKAKFEAPKHHAEIFSGRKSINDVNNVSILVFDLSILFYTASAETAKHYVTPMPDHELYLFLIYLFNTRYVTMETLS